MSGRARRIAIVRQRYNPFGGAERFVERALQALVAEGAEVTLLTRDWQGAAQSGFAQILCNPPYGGFGNARVARDQGFARAVQEILAQGRFDIVQSHERIAGCTIFRAGDGVHAAWLDHRARVLSPWRRLGQHLSPYHRYLLEAERTMFADARLRAVICNSQMVADEVAAYHPLARDKCRVIYNGVDTAAFSPEAVQPLGAEVRSALGIAEELPVLLFVGNGFERKGVPQLLRALAMMRQRETQLVIVGSDHKLKSMRRLAEGLGILPRVHFVGAQKDVLPYLGAADGFVLPTIYDPGPNAVLEALACGLPVLTTTTCGAKEWIAEGHNGWVVDALDLDTMAARLDDLCTTSGMAVSARNSVAHLTLPAMADRLLDLYRSLEDN